MRISDLFRGGLRQRHGRLALASLGIVAVCAAALMVGCRTAPPPTESLPAPVVRVPVVPPTTGPTNVPAPAMPAAPNAAVPVSPGNLAVQPFPPNILYMCVTGAGSAVQQTAIEFVPKVLELCRRHPEMGPCQYERETCRRGGGRVFTAEGTEITRATEAEYDKRVYRVRFRGD